MLLDIAAVLQKNVRPPALLSANGRNGHPVSLDGVSFSEGELLLQVQQQKQQNIGLHLCTGVYLSVCMSVILYFCYFCRL